MSESAAQNSNTNLFHDDDESQAEILFNSGSESQNKNDNQPTNELDDILGWGSLDSTPNASPILGSVPASSAAFSEIFGEDSDEGIFKESKQVNETSANSRTNNQTDGLQTSESNKNTSKLQDTALSNLFEGSDSDDGLFGTASQPNKSINENVNENENTVENESINTNTVENENTVESNLKEQLKELKIDEIPETINKTIQETFTDKINRINNYKMKYKPIILNIKGGAVMTYKFIKQRHVHGTVQSR